MNHFCVSTIAQFFLFSAAHPTTNKLLARRELSGGLIRCSLLVSQSNANWDCVPFRLIVVFILSSLSNGTMKFTPKKNEREFLIKQLTVPLYGSRAHVKSHVKPHVVSPPYQRRGLEFWHFYRDEQTLRLTFYYTNLYRLSRKSEITVTSLRKLHSPGCPLRCLHFQCNRWLFRLFNRTTIAGDSRKELSKLQLRFSFDRPELQ